MRYPLSRKSPKSEARIAVTSAVGQHHHADAELHDAFVHDISLRFLPHFHEAFARLAADELHDAALRGGVDLIGRAVVEDLSLARAQTRQRVEHDHAIGHLLRRAHVVRHDDAGHRASGAASAGSIR